MKNNKDKKGLKKEASRIINILLEMYNKGIEVNKPFESVVNDVINDEYKSYKEAILIELVPLIPLNLMICPNHKWVFVTDEEFRNILKNKFR